LPVPTAVHAAIAIPNCAADESSDKPADSTALQGAQYAAVAPAYWSAGGLPDGRSVGTAYCCPYHAALSSALTFSYFAAVTQPLHGAYRGAIAAACRGSCFSADQSTHLSAYEAALDASHPVSVYAADRGTL
jgi:hypothetical protein